ncbi:hypothetical protein [Arthrobacter sp. SDTb3-6]|uniref:hypothetical protein n=1 Tax=Arthrobacter sp. SDTb3-6 TaxID=2713571 RepID=UPI00159D5B70|nr:hypothetical protein [Arthrobacter sp. SDTb3-6]NVN00815.1 hypothetical protein [Arthrobacter sp. SDTb3-6]
MIDATATHTRPARRADGRPRRVPRRLLALVSTGFLAAVIWWVIVPQYGEAAATLRSLKKLSLPLVLLVVTLELSSLTAYPGLTTSILGTKRPHYATMFRIDLTGLGVNHVRPWGLSVQRLALST